MARTDTTWTNRSGEYIETNKPTGYHVLINGENRYLNFNSIVGSLGYGIRDNNGTMQFKNIAGSWTDFGSGGGGAWGTITGTITDQTDLITYLSTNYQPIGSYLTEETDPVFNAWLLSTPPAYPGDIPDVSVYELLSNKSTNVITDGASDTKYPSVKAIKDYADGLVAGLLDYRGGYDASGNTYPTTGGSGTAGAVMKGDMWVISVAGTLGGEAVQVGDSIIANVDTPGQTASNWNHLNGNISYVPENVANKENTTIDNSTTKYPTVNLLKTGLDLKAPLASPTFSGIITTQNSADTASNQVLLIKGANRTTATNGDEIYTSFQLEDSAGNQSEFARINIIASQVSSTSKKGVIEFGLAFDGDEASVWTPFVFDPDTGLKVRGQANLSESELSLPKTGSRIELGHASDTTLSRVSAGVIAVEGIPVITANSTTVGQVPTITGTNTYSWQTPSAGSALWTLMPGTPTRVGNTSFTVTGDVTSYVAKGMIIKWTESGTVRVGMVSIPSTYGAPNTTITIIGDTMSSIDASSLKYCMLGAEVFSNKQFAIAGNIGATGTNVTNIITAHEPMRIIGCDVSVGVAGTTNNTTFDINKNGTSIFTTKPTLATTVRYSPTPFSADSGSSMALGDYLSLDVDAYQTTNAQDGYLPIYWIPTRYLNLS